MFNKTYKYIKSFDVSIMRMPFELYNNVERPQLCFIEYNRDAATNEIVSEFKHIRDTTIFTESSYTTSLDRFIELINRCINYYVKDVKDGVDCRLLYGNFTIEENTLQYKYLNEQHGNIPNKIAVLGFNSVFVDIILKYFDIHYVKEDPFEFYYI